MKFGGGGLFLIFVLFQFLFFIKCQVVFIISIFDLFDWLQKNYGINIGMMALYVFIIH